MNPHPSSLPHCLSFRRVQFIAPLLLLSSLALAADTDIELTLTLPPEMKVQSALATATTLKLESPGKVDGPTIKFPKLLPIVPYDLRLTLSDGTILQGVDMSWYNEEPLKKNVEPLSDEDREACRAQVSDIPSFYDRKEIILLQGDHSRAVALVRLVRDSAFHASKKGEAIWRIELWYLKNQYGGWEIIQQQNKVLRRERFKTEESYKSVEKIKWTPSLGGLRLEKSTPHPTLTFSPPPPPSTAPTPKPND